MTTYTCDNWSATTGGIWHNQNARGHEEIVPTGIMTFPYNDAGTFLMVGSADHAGFVFDDISYDNYAADEVRDLLTVANPYVLKKTNSIDYCYSQPNHILRQVMED